ncbi:T3SS effector cysteine hydrolase SpvD family protein [Escherichia marmotae]|nr:T3SS effector cysteine hydrolase SpvD family protein [Escherichia marmotae]AUT30163.1 virulence protein SpvD [Escherichia marmotae]
MIVTENEKGKMIQGTSKIVTTNYRSNTEISIKEEIYDNYLKNRGSADIERAYKSLYISDVCKFFNNKEINLSGLRRLARFTNSAQFHYSGNCVLLAACFHYNIKNGGYFLSAKNISNPFSGLDSICVDTLIFGKSLNESYSLGSFYELKNYIVNCYLNTGNISFIIHAEGTILGGRMDTAHDFNAVIVNTDGNIRVVFVDSWKTVHKVKSETQMENSIHRNTYFYVRY